MQNRHDEMTKHKNEERGGVRPMMKTKMAMTVEEASEYTGIGRNTIRQLVRWKKLPVLRIGRKIIIRTDALDRFVSLNEGKNLRNETEIRPIEIAS